MASETLELGSAREAQTLYASDERNLISIENSLGVKITSREGWIKVEGEQEAVNRTRELFKAIQIALSEGIQVRRQEFNYALNKIARNEPIDFRKLYSNKIQVSPRKGVITPKTVGQQEYVDAMRNHDIVFGIGPAGTGKTYLAMAMAVSALRSDRVSRIILTRPAVEAGEALGFLPGDLNEKVLPYLRPLYDALYDMMEEEEIARLQSRRAIEVAPLAYMRGRTLNNSFIILDEAQNSTCEQMFMFLTRMGFDSKCVVTGDDTQIDLPASRKSGLIEVQQMLRKIDGIRFCYLSEKDVVRHELVQKIILAYRHGRQNQVDAQPGA